MNEQEQRKKRGNRIKLKVDEHGTNLIQMLISFSGREEKLVDAPGDYNVFITQMIRLDVIAHELGFYG